TRRSQRRDSPRTIYNSLYVDLPGQIDKTPDLAVAGNFTGEEYVGNSVRDQSLGLRERRARHADGPRIDLAARQGRTLVVLVMRTQLGRAGAKKVCHLGQIALHGVQIQKKRRRVDFAQSHLSCSAG